MTDYSSITYWENRYTNEHLEIFEWYQTYETLKEKISEYIKPTDKILNAGCGTSKFSEDLYIDDIKDVTNIDFSENAIKIMTEYYQEQQVEMNYKKMNVCEMREFMDKTFDGFSISITEYSHIFSSNNNFLLSSFALETII